MASASQLAETSPCTGCSLMGSREGQRRGDDGKEMAPGGRRLGWELPSALRAGMRRRHNTPV